MNPPNLEDTHFLVHGVSRIIRSLSFPSLPLQLSNIQLHCRPYNGTRQTFARVIIANDTNDRSIRLTREYYFLPLTPPPVTLRSTSRVPHPIPTTTFLSFSLSLFLFLPQEIIFYYFLLFSFSFSSAFFFDTSKQRSHL